MSFFSKVIGSKVMESSSITGTGAFNLGTTVGAFKTWRSVFATGAQVLYVAENGDGSSWEIGYGTLTYGTPDTLSRNLISSSTGSLISWVVADAPIYIFSAPLGEALEGRYDGTNGFFVPAMRQPYTATGTSGKTITAADVGGRFSFDNAAANRNVTLPAISAVAMGFSFEVVGLSLAGFYVTLTPSGTDAIDSQSASAVVSLPGKKPVKVWSDGAQWRTDFDWESWHVIAALTPSGVATVDVTGIPASAKDIRGYLEIVPATDAVSISLRTYGADGVLDVGASDYDWGAFSMNAAVAVGAVTTSLLLSNGATVDNGTRGFTARFEAANIQAATFTKFLYQSDYLDSAGTILVGLIGHGSRQEADRITGVRLLTSSGNMTGRWLVEAFFA